MSHSASHKPEGDPCVHCGQSAVSHRVYHAHKAREGQGDGPCETCGLSKRMHRKNGKKPFHAPKGDPCETCGERASSHRVSHKFVGHGERCEKCGLIESQHRSRRNSEARNVYIGIDGEGRGRIDHKYILLAASSETGADSWAVAAEPGEGLSTKECLDMILSLPTRRTRIFSFSFNYDITMMLRDVDDKTLYHLNHPELRKSENGKGLDPVFWRGYFLNLQGTKFSVQRRRKRVVVWDLFKFFQSSFVKALKLWKTGDPAMWERIQGMKVKRSDFDKESDEAIKKYCLEECRAMAQLARKLIDAHDKANLKLKSYYGAGSSGAAMLSAMGLLGKTREGRPEMKEAIACAFFGGRFENSVIGQVEGPIYEKDISSAYPYQCFFLPCLQHGEWEYTRDRKVLDEGDVAAALVHYTFGDPRDVMRKGVPWGPFPFRTADGTISFPLMSGGGWVWQDEYKQGERLWPHVGFIGAWVKRIECECQPFQKIAEYYIQRLILGKEGPGLVLKLGCNSCYGKLAQSVGKAQFNSWIWAAMITSGTRAQILEVLGLHKDWRNLLTIATDGIRTREFIVSPKPRNTGTDAMGKPLGGWEDKGPDRTPLGVPYSKKGMFVARPGIYFPLNPTKDEVEEIKGRGVGKGVVYENWRIIVDAWEKGGVDAVAKVANLSRFCGMKTSISYSPKKKKFTRASGEKGKNWQPSDGEPPAYGQWITRPVELTFNPMPKRAGVLPDGRSLAMRVFPADLTSVPYDRAMRSPEGEELAAATQEILEQPGGDLALYE